MITNYPASTPTDQRHHQIPPTPRSNNTHPTAKINQQPPANIHSDKIQPINSTPRHHRSHGARCACRRGALPERSVPVLSISTGAGSAYYTAETAKTSESYYTGAVTDGEPPGRWSGAGAETFGLRGEVDAQDMTALYDQFIDPHDERFREPARWPEAARLGRPPAQHRTAVEIEAEMLAAEQSAGPERREEVRFAAARRVRKAVSFVDLTFSVQKSVTLMHTAFAAQEVAAQKAGNADEAAGWSEYRRAVEEAIWAGNRAMLDFMAEHAGYARVGHHGGAAGRWTDAHDWTVASFFQHTSRDLDPQLHIHNVVLNRVQCADGEFRTLDSQAIHRWRAAGGAVGERTMEEHLTRTLAQRFATRPDGKAREALGVPQAGMDLMSSRSRTIGPKVHEMLASFEERHGRAPNPLELDRLKRRVTSATRRAKGHDTESVEDKLARWDRELRAEVAGGLREVAHSVLEQSTGERPAEPWSPEAVIAEALAAAQANGSTVTRAEFIRHANACLPDSLGGLTGPEVVRLLNGLADQALGDAGTPHAVLGAVSSHGAVSVTGAVDASLPAELVLANGRSAYEAPGSREYATVGHLATERALRQAAVVRGGRAASPAAVDRWLRQRADEGLPLGEDQAAAVRGVLTSGSAVEVLVGPAGTGKSHVAGAIAQAWADPALWNGREPGRVIGLATSQIATDVLADEGIEARNIARWLHTQRRLTSGPGQPQDEPWRLTPADVVLVDEAAMADTADLDEIRGHVERAGAKLLLTGDHRQLAAVGAGGAMSMLADRSAQTYELAEVRRFNRGWEAGASLRLRDGDASVLSMYDRHGALHDGGTAATAERAAVHAWLGDFLDGRETLLVVDTNEQAARLSAQVRAELVALGRVEEDGVPLDRQGTAAGVGDVVAARRNDRALGVTNRQTYRVLQVTDDNGLVVQTTGDEPRRITLPGAYVKDHVELAYAGTAHSAQGRTVDTAHAVLTAGTPAAGMYVAMSRGRDGNTAYVVTRPERSDAPTGEAHDTEPRLPAAVLADALEADEPDRAALVVAAESAADAGSIQTIVERYADAVDQVMAGRVASTLDRLTTDGVLTADERAAFAADPAMTQLGWLLRSAELAGHDVDQVVRDAVGERSLSGARRVAQVTHSRIAETLRGNLTPSVDSFADAVPTTNGAWNSYVTRLAELADDRRRTLGTEMANDAPQWAVDAFGVVPAGVIEREEWEHRAGAVAAYRELTGHTDDATPIPPAPGAGLTEHRASWAAAWRALGRPETGRDEAEMTEGQLRVRVRAYERELTWAPDYVGDELRATAQAAARHRQDAAVTAARAEAEPDPTRRTELATEAELRRALADVLGEVERDLDTADEGRAEWYAHVAPTRQAAERAERELRDRGIEPGDEPDRVTAAEWLAAELTARVEDDAHRAVTETDVVHRVDRPAGAERSATPAMQPPAVADEPAPALPAGVPTIAETAAKVLRAQQALRQIEARRAEEAMHQAEAEEQESRETAWRQDRAAVDERADADVNA